MNSTLCEFAAETIYKQQSDNILSLVVKYKPANPTISNQSSYLSKISMESDTRFYFPLLNNKDIDIIVENPFLKIVVDQQYSLAVGLLSSISPDKPSHNSLIAVLVNIFRYLNSIQHPQETDEEFLKKRIMVITPHNSQRLNIQSALKNQEFFWAKKWIPNNFNFIQTVEKAQGREVDTVIIDYGISDIHLIKKFIYNRNRLNVSITRAKKKCIVFLSESLLNPTETHSPTTELGYEYIQALISFTQQKKSYYKLQEKEIQQLLQTPTDPLLRKTFE